MERRDEKHYVLAYASTGYGHLYALNALAEAIRSAEPASRIAVVDVLGDPKSCAKRAMAAIWRHFSTSLPLRALYRLAYPQLVRLDVLARLLALITRASSGRDAFVDAHHYMALHPAAVAFGVDLKKRTGCRLSVVATDYVFHALHCHALVDDYFVPASAAVLGQTPRRAIERGSVVNRGIPVAARFLDGALARRSERAEPLHVLVTFGASGLRGLENLDLLRALLLRTDCSVRISLVAGKNETLLRAFHSLVRETGSADRTSIYGLVSDMAALMRSAHVLVGKAGGITVTEARCLALPLAIVDTLPGQEDYNSTAVVKDGVGLRIGGVDELLGFLQLLREPSEWLRWSTGHSMRRDRGAAVTPRPAEPEPNK